jgi:hypothetical protein
VLLVLIGAVLIIGAGYVFASRSAGAKVVITPKQQEVSVDSQFNAQKGTSSTLQYQTVTISKDGKMVVEANGDEYVNTKASGTIIIYNNYSADSQKLVASTRFEAPNGKIFRISQPVTVPGKKGDTPGSIEAIITADQAGPDYNVGLVDFTIPGFKDDGAKY